METEPEEYAECEICHLWFGFIPVNPALMRAVCDGCINVWRNKYVKG